MTRKENNGFPRERLLDEAEALFARKGFEAVSVREITRAADCNLASVNYHFGGKKNLYLEVFRARWLPRALRIQECFKTSLASHVRLSPAVVVQALAEAFLKGGLTDDERMRHSQLMAREMARPGEAFDMVSEGAMRPFIRELVDMLQSSMPGGRDDESLMLDVLSILAVVLFFNFARSAVARLAGSVYDSAFKDRLVEHIMEFALKGLGVGKGEDLL